MIELGMIEHLNDRTFNDQTLNDRTLNDRTFNDRTWNDRTLNDRNFNNRFFSYDILSPQTLVLFQTMFVFLCSLNLENLLLVLIIFLIKTSFCLLSTSKRTC